MEPVISILFEDQDVLAVNKPEGIASIPERSEDSQNLLGLLEKMYKEKLYIVHRLDKEVSGVILFARNARAHRTLNLQFSSREVRKTYMTLVHGVVERESGIIEKAIREFGSGRMGVDESRGKPSITTYRIEERLPNYTLLQVYPFTGRRHQIRVHMYSIGHPVVGDIRYGDKELQSNYPRLMLHAGEVDFSLISGERITLRASLPDSFNSVMDNIREGNLS